MNMDEFERYAAQLKSPKIKIRAKAAFKLGQLGNSEAISWLEKSLTDISPIVRCRTANALSRLEDPRVVGLLITALNDPDDQVYGCAASALSKIGNEQAITTLINEVRHQEVPRLSIATNNLIKIGKPAVASLINAFDNSSGRPRAYFLKALGKIGDMSASKVFRKAILDEDNDVFWVATAIQREIRDSDAVPALIASLEHKDTLRQVRAARALWSSGDKRAVKRLTKVAEDKNRGELARCEAMLALGKLGGAEVVRPLLRGLNEESWRIQWSALMGLSYTGDPKVVEFLLDLANERPDDIRYHTVIRNLGAFGSQLTLKELESILRKRNHYDSRVQQTAKKSIEQLNLRWNK